MTLTEKPGAYLDAGVIFLAAALLFEVEPLIAKLILPWFGGSAAVWITCLLFFQATLLCGYLYAHILIRWVAERLQVFPHIALLLLSLFTLPIIPSPHWKPLGAENPQLHILGLLATTIGIPFFLLSSTTPLITAWRSKRDANLTSQSLIRLYALSNLGSLLALASYPILVEPAIPTRMQALIWSGIYVVFVVLSMITSWSRRSLAADKSREISHAAAVPPPELVHRVFWVLLPAAASALLLAVTSFILRNIAAIPLLWVVPLALYLASFVITFDSPRWYWRSFWLPLFALFSGIMIYQFAGKFPVQHYVPLLIFNSASLFVCCVVCHGELARLKPAPAYLTPFYVSISAGGVIGSIFIATIAPLVFDADIDLPIVLPTTILLVIAVIFLNVGKSRRPTAWLPVLRPSVWLLVLAAALVIWALDTGRMVNALNRNLASATYLERNFYGPLRVATFGPVRALLNGNIIHGSEFLSPSKQTQPTTYYGPQSGLGQALSEVGRKTNLRVGIVGLGAGTIAAYGRPGDTYHFYEINRADVRIAETYFHYLSLSQAHSEISIGDARLSLEKETPQNFDFLAIDAFTGDSIPVHLLTQEAFALYYRHLGPHGILAVHVSNSYIDLAPIVALAARSSGKIARMLKNTGDARSEQDTSNWVIIAPDEAFFQSDRLRGATKIVIPASLKPWTDDYSNLWKSLR